MSFDMKTYQQDWYRRNREKSIARAKVRYEADPETHNERSRQWKLANPEKVRESNAASQHRNLDRHRDNQAKRRARKKNAFAEPVHPLMVLERDDGICGICGKDVDPFDFHIDHIVPLAKGGEHSYMNTQVAHPPCNIRKGAKI